MRIAYLDGFRGIAIIWVILFHAYTRWSGILSFPTATKDFILFEYGFLGVQLFFMISGFVIFMTLDKSINYIDFMKKRWLRLFPAMLIVSIIVFLTASFFYERPAGQPVLLDLIPGLTFIKPSIISILVGHPVNGLEGAFWSLYVEVIFYAIIGLVYFIFGRKFCIPALFSLFSVSTIVFMAQQFGITLKLPLIILDALGFWHYGWFIIGCIMYEVINGRSSKAALLIGALSGLMIIMRLLYDPNYSWLQDNLGFNWNLILMNLAVMTLFITSFYVKTIQKILSFRILLFIGVVSYPLYLIHENILIASLIKFEKLGLSQHTMYLMPVLVSLILIGVAYLITKFVEPATRKLLQRIV